MRKLIFIFLSLMGITLLALEPKWGIVNVWESRPGNIWLNKELWKRDLHYLNFLGVEWSRPNCAAWIKSSSATDIDFRGSDTTIYYLGLSQ